ncbi:MAG: carboxynorspermidine decarboxylase [Clostridiales bacterium]|jgi:carboxynorspermidine decarboxylase|nr:carboxynorspermidine decarboxylase [Clostridiales bacterium]
MNFDPNKLETPCYIVDEALLIKNLEILKSVIKRTGCKILLAQKAFSMYSLYPLIGQYLHGTAASGLHEARLGREEMGGEVHIHSPVYRRGDFDEILGICDYIVFNSFNEWQKYRQKAMVANRPLKFGIRINPEFSTQTNPLYDPCAQGSRLGTTLKNFRPDLLDGISGIHFHTLCEQNSDALAATLEAVEAKFGQYLHGMEWINFGGGHYITRDDYDIDTLVACITRFQQKYGLEVYLEPGEAVALDAGFLVASVVEIAESGKTKNAFLDASAACHIPEILAFRYRVDALGAGVGGEKAHNYTLVAPTCLSGDVFGEYSFDEPLKINDRIIFTDSATYTMVKNNTFNGVRLPDIAIARQNGEIEVVKRFGYEDFKSRL